MPRIEPADKTLKELSGFHLWHAPMSSCSQRVRITLEETGQDYESHVVNLEKDEHAAAAYQAIHPKGLVPAFVDNGDLFIESIDIIQHIAGKGSDLTKVDAPALLDMDDAAQIDLKLLTFEFLFRANPPPPPEAVEAFQAGHQNEWLRQFRLDFAKGFDRERLDDAVTRTHAGFKTLNDHLSDGRTFLSGSNFSLTDIAWMPNMHRFALMDWPFERLPPLSAWFERIKTRPSYQKGLLNWQDGTAATKFVEYTQMRRQAGTDIRNFGDLKL